MTDLIERAQDREQYDRDIALSNVARHAPMLPACGECYNCQATLPEGVRFCDSDCRNDYAARKASEVRRG